MDETNERTELKESFINTKEKGSDFLRNSKTGKRLLKLSAFKSKLEDVKFCGEKKDKNV